MNFQFLICSVVISEIFYCVSVGHFSTLVPHSTTACDIVYRSKNYVYDCLNSVCLRDLLTQYLSGAGGIPQGSIKCTQRVAALVPTTIVVDSKRIAFCICIRCGGVAESARSGTAGGFKVQLRV